MSSLLPQDESPAQNPTAPVLSPARPNLRLILPLLLVPLLPLLLVLWNWGSSSTEVGYFAGNTNVGEILAGQRYGQTFTPIYPGLSGITVAVGDYARVNTGTLTLRLYEAGSSEQIARADLPTEGFSNNPRVLFEFPPLGTETRGKLLRFDIEDQNGVAFQNAVTLFSSTFNPYGGGIAYFNGRAEPGADILFGMRYSLSAPEIWGAQIANWAGSVSPILSLLAGVGLFGVLGGAVWLLVVLAGGVRDALAGKAVPPPIRAGLLPLVLLTLLGLANGLTWAIFTPPWHGPDEPQHFAYAAALARQGLGTEGKSDPIIRAGVVAAMDSHQFTRYVPWAPEPGASADDFFVTSFDTFWVQLRQARPYYILLGAAFQVSGFVPDEASWSDPTKVDALLYLGRAVSVMLQTLLVALAWMAGRALGVRGGSTALALAVALLPMPAFIHAMINNDVLASVAGAILGLYVIRAVQRFRLIDLPLLIIGVALVPLSKFTALPMVGLAVLALIVGLWLHAGRVVKVVLGLAVLLALLVPVVLFYSILDTGTYARSWTAASYLPPQRVANGAHDGEYAISAGSQRVMQRATLAQPHGVLTATGTIWVRGAGPGTISLSYNALPPTSTVTLPASASWSVISTSMTVPADAQFLNIYLQSQSGGAEFDSAELVVRAADGSAQSNLLQNPSFEVTTPVLPTNLPGLSPQAEGYLILNYIADPVGLDLFWSRETSLFRSFFANFGWVAVELPDWTYAAWGGLLLLALVGGFVSLFARIGGSDGERQKSAELKAIFLLSMIGLVGAALLAYLRTAATLKAYGSNEFPQGRYLFPILIPIATATVLGLRGGWLLLSPVLARRRGVVGAWLIYSGAALLLAYAALAFTSVLGFYYGR